MNGDDPLAFCPTRIRDLETAPGQAGSDYEAAKQALRRAPRLAPDDLEALSWLRWAQTLLRDNDEAVLRCQHVLVVSQDDVPSRLDLGAATGRDRSATRCAEAARGVESGQAPVFDPSSPAV